MFKQKNYFVNKSAICTRGPWEKRDVEFCPLLPSPAIVYSALLIGFIPTLEQLIMYWTESKSVSMTKANGTIECAPDSCGRETN